MKSGQLRNQANLVNTRLYLEKRFCANSGKYSGDFWFVKFSCAFSSNSDGSFEDMRKICEEE